MEIKMRSMPAGFFLFSMILACGFLCVSGLGISIFWRDTESPEMLNRFFIALVIVFFAIPSLAWMCFNLYHFFTIFNFSEGAVCVSQPFHKKAVIPYAEISMFGAASYMGFGSQIFLCTLSNVQLEDYFRFHADACRKMYGNDCYNYYAQSEEGRQKMAVGLYVRDNRLNVYSLNYFSSQRLSQIRGLLKKPEVHTGPILLPREFKKSAK